jgi:hypothetical protein
MRGACDAQKKWYVLHMIHKLGPQLALQLAMQAGAGVRPLFSLPGLLFFYPCFETLLTLHTTVSTPACRNLLVQLSIFLIDLFVGTYRLSSHARLEAFVTQTKLI